MRLGKLVPLEQRNFPPLDFPPLRCDWRGGKKKKRENARRGDVFIFAMRWIFDVEFDCVCRISCDFCFDIREGEKEMDKKQDIFERIGN